jgi:broad specificity phosphatase PhoE
MEPIILELEREENDLLIIAHESVLRVLYGYLMACNAADIPKLEFPRDEIIEVRLFQLSQAILTVLRSFLPATTTSQSESRFPIFRIVSSLEALKTLAYLSPQVEP